MAVLNRLDNINVSADAAKILFGKTEDIKNAMSKIIQLIIRGLWHDSNKPSQS